VYCVCDEAYQVAAEYNAFYEDCVACNAISCNEVYAFEIEEELRKVTQLESENRATVESTLAMKERCSVRRRDAQTILTKYNNNGIPWIEAEGARDSDVCTFDENGLLVLNGVQNVELARGDAVDVADGYEKSSTANVNTLATYIPERSAYDAEYLANKSAFIDVTVGSIPLEFNAAVPDITGSIVPSLTLNLTFTVECLSPNPDPDFDRSTCPGASAAEALEMVYDQASANLADAVASGEELLAESAQTAEFYANQAARQIEEMNNQILALENSISVAAATLNDLDVVGVPDLEFPALSGGYPDFSTDFVDDLALDIDTSFLTELPSAAELAEFQAVDNILEGVINATANVAAGVGDSLAVVGDSISNTADAVAEAATPDDYMPPVCCGEDGESAEEIQARQASESETFNEQHTASINAFGESSTNDDLETYNPPTFNTSNFDIENLVAQSSFTWDFIPMDGTDFPAEWFLLQIDGLVHSVILLDAAWRIFRSLQIFIRYYSKTTVIGKPFDVRVEKAIVKGCGKYIPTTTAQTIQYAVLSPLTPAAIGLFLVWLFVILLVNIYVPFFNDYTDGCVENGQLVTSCDALTTQPECLAAAAAQDVPCTWQSGKCSWSRDSRQYPTPNDFKYGTFVENNLYSVAYNYASESGNNEYWTSLDDYNIRSSQNCAEYGQASADEYQRREQDYLSSLSLLDFLREETSVMSQCLDYVAMDADLLETLENGNDPAISAAFTTDDVLSTDLDPNLNAECLNEPTSVLFDSTFDCTNLPECRIGCNGVEWDVIRTWTYGCGCYTEWFIHSHILVFGMGTFIYLSLNVSRNIFIDGLCRIYYHELGSGLYEFRANCDVHANYEEFIDQKDLRKKIHVALRKRKCFGYWLVFGAALMQIPWIVLLSQLIGQVDFGDVSQFDACETRETVPFVCNLG